MTSSTNRRYVRGMRVASLMACVVVPMAAMGSLVVLSMLSELPDTTLIGEIHSPASDHVDQMALKDLVAAGKRQEAFTEAFKLGDELFETVFNALDGVGANVGNGQRFTRVPRADLAAPGQWATHVPRRITGPNAANCNACHNQPVNDGAGLTASNVHRDPEHSASLRGMIQRNTPHLFAPGAVQRLAEEMTEELHRIRARAEDEACRGGGSARRQLYTKGVSFGSITVRLVRSRPCQVEVDTSEVVGVDPDLVVQPFQWKGVNASIRDFNRGAAHNELGMQSVEIVGESVDGDHDGVVNELTIGDQTALAVYLAAQPRPTTKRELSALGLIPALDDQEVVAIRRGGERFDDIGCDRCHRPALTLNNPIFGEPSRNPHYRDAILPAGQDPVAHGVDPQYPVTFDLTKDQPDNIVRDENGKVVFRLGSLRKNRRGQAVVELYGDLKRHDMGPRLGESIDDTGVSSSVFLTENLWGVGSTAPYLHDGRATTLTEAILEHGGEAERSRNAFAALSPAGQKDVIAFLENLVLFKIEEEGSEEANAEEEAPAVAAARGG